MRIGAAAVATHHRPIIESVCNEEREGEKKGEKNKHQTPGDTWWREVIPRWKKFEKGGNAVATPAYTVISPRLWGSAGCRFVEPVDGLRSVTDWLRKGSTRIAFVIPLARVAFVLSGRRGPFTNKQRF